VTISGRLPSLKLGTHSTSAPEFIIEFSHKQAQKLKTSKIYFELFVPFCGKLVPGASGSIHQSTQKRMATARGFAQAA
jgi:hypothetical protein